MDQLIEYPTDKEIQLQRYIQSLHQELQVSHQTKLSLQEALVETNKQGTVCALCNAMQVYEPMHIGWLYSMHSTSCSNAVFIILYVYKAKVAENEAYITELLEEKTKAVEQYLKEKQIITG